MFTLKNALLVVIAIASQSAMNGVVCGQAQQWASLPTDKPAAGETTRVTGMFKNKENADPVVIKRYVQNEVARFTNVTAETDTASFAPVRHALIAAIRSAQSEPAKKLAADHLVTLTKVIGANARYHPAARINSMAALTELELVSNSPYSETFLPLVNIAKDETQLLHIRAIAIYGLNRHARLTKLTPAFADGLAKAMTVIVASQPKSAIDVKAHAWMVRRGFDVLSTLAANHAVQPAIARLLDDKELPSLRLAAAEYLPRVDQTKLKLTDEQKVQYFIGLAQVLEQQLVMWYEREEDKLNMKSGAAAGGGMGGMMGGMDGGMGGDGGASDGGYNMDGGMGGGGGGGGRGGMGMGGMEGGMGGMGMGGMGAGGMGTGATAAKPKALETQPWEVRMTRRNVNQILQIAHVALDSKQTKSGRPVSAVGKGLVDLELPADISTPASDLLKAIESLQNRINDSSKITTMNSLMSQTKKLIEKIMDQVREVPALTTQYPKYQQKDKLNEVLDQPKASLPAADGTPAAEGAGTPAAEGAGAPASGTPAPGNPETGTPATGNPATGAPAPGAQPGAGAPAGPNAGKPAGGN